MLLEKASEKPLTRRRTMLTARLCYRWYSLRDAYRKFHGWIVKQWTWRTYSNAGAAWTVEYYGTTFDYYSDGLLAAYDKGDPHKWIVKTRWRCEAERLQMAYPSGSSYWCDQKEEFQEAYRIYVARQVLA